MITLRLGSSIVAALFFVTSCFLFLLAAVVAIAGPSGLAGLGALALLLPILGFGSVLYRRFRADRDGAVVATGGKAVASSEARALGSPVSEDVFLVFARHSQGAWTQQGAVFFGDSIGVFLPMGPPSHLLVDFILALVAPRFRFADVSFEIGAASPEALAEAARRYDGLLLTPEWRWKPDQRWLKRDAKGGIVALEREPPAERMVGFPLAEGPTVAELRRNISIVLLLAVAVAAGFASIGVVGYYLSRDVEILLGFLAFAVMFGGAFVFAAGVIWNEHRKKTRGVRV